VYIKSVSTVAVTNSTFTNNAVVGGYVSHTSFLFHLLLSICVSICFINVGLGTGAGCTCQRCPTSPSPGARFTTTR
jgi:hypothetical protein